jgi:hypothetical protein
MYKGWVMRKINVKENGKPRELEVDTMYKITDEGKNTVFTSPLEYILIIDKISFDRVIGTTIEENTMWEWVDRKEEFIENDYTSITEMGKKEDFPEYFI